MQCAAVIIQSGVTSDPPQNPGPKRAACHGHSPSWAGWPPTIVDSGSNAIVWFPHSASSGNVQITKSLKENGIICSLH